MKVNQIKLGSAFSYIQIIVNVLIGLLYTPIMLRLLGQSEYGLYNVAASTISMLSVLGLGLTSSYVHFYAGYKKNQDEQGIRKLNGLFLIVLSVIGVIAFACGMVISGNLSLVFDQGLSASEYQTAKILMRVMVINLAISFPMSVFTCIISANERFVFLKLLGIIKTVIGPLATLPILLMGYGSVGMVLVTLGSSLLVDVIYLYYTFRVLRQRFVFHDFESGLFKSVFVFTAFIALNLIVNQINDNVGKLLLGRYRGTDEVAVFSVGHSLFNYYTMLSTAISGVFVPRIHHIVRQTEHDMVEQRARLTSLFVRIGRLQFALLALVGSGVFFFGKRFITGYWAGAGYKDSYIIALILIVSGSIALIQNVGIEIQRAENKHRFRSILYIGMALLNLVVSVFLCKKYGAIGCTLGTAISYVMVNGIVMNIYYHKKCNINVLAFWRSILWMAKALLLPIGCGLLIYKFIPQTSIWLFGAGICIYSLIYMVSMWFFGFNAEERGLFTGILTKFRKKR